MELAALPLIALSASAVASVGSTVMGIGGALQQKYQMQAQAREKADQALAEEAGAAQRELGRQTELDQIIARQHTLFSAAGRNPGAGSPAAVTLATYRNSYAEGRRDKTFSRLTAAGLRSSALALRASGKAAFLGGTLGAGFGLLGDLGSLGLEAYKLSPQTQKKPTG